MPRWTGVRYFQGASRRAAQGAFLFFLVKGLLWLLGPALLLLAR